MIVCIGWGSLIWRPDGLPLSSEWHEDGPELPIEYARQSKSRALTLVIAPGAELVRSLWASLAVSSLDGAVEALASREGTPNARSIGRWPTSNAEGSIYRTIAGWAEQRGVSGAVWTALPAKFNGEARIPTATEAIAYLRSLSGAEARDARTYVERTPPQVRTRLRAVIERELGWRATG